ncbi:hypothetical protein [Novosphingobium taihuense]|uniref:HEAT repeat protein n=1 Tax=Novosphingobium taihuense TaxID=260085 RepID=A0A7W7A9W5_9SPHN|nr:hypothetical protein [Novosphingobium taihuense]MBB4612937.1 hypothetical protein [Novosphingobium taihuense]TWH81875.1 hypothetical protein IQ25_03398 [Novosphingobium taihuense]
MLLIMSSNGQFQLSSELQIALENVGKDLAARRDASRAFFAVPTMLDAIEPSALSIAESRIIEAAQLYRFERPVPLWRALILREINASYQLKKISQIENLFIFHRNGHLRQAALDKFLGPISSPFVMVAVAWRLNDWVPEVRHAAAECIGRCFPITDPEIIAQAALVLLLRRGEWGRWTRTEQALLDSALGRHDALSSLAALLVKLPTGSNAKILRESLRYSGLDIHLLKIAREAVQPATRAVAYQTVIGREARWPDGRKWRWVDKSMGIGRFDPTFSTRPLVADENGGPLKMILEALTDRSGLVRSVAMSGLIKHRDEFTDAKLIAQAFLGDPARSVRARAEFLMKS